VQDIEDITNSGKAYEESQYKLANLSTTPPGPAALRRPARRKVSTYWPIMRHHKLHRREDHIRED